MWHEAMFSCILSPPMPPGATWFIYRHKSTHTRLRLWHDNVSSDCHAGGASNIVNYVLNATRAHKRILIYASKGSESHAAAGEALEWSARHLPYEFIYAFMFINSNYNF